MLRSPWSARDDRVIVPPGMRPPDVSPTRPVITPSTVCENASAGRQRTRIKLQSAASFLMVVPPLQTALKIRRLRPVNVGGVYFCEESFLKEPQSQVSRLTCGLRGQGELEPRITR